MIKSLTTYIGHTQVMNKSQQTNKKLLTDDAICERQQETNRKNKNLTFPLTYQKRQVFNSNNMHFGQLSVPFSMATGKRLQFKITEGWVCLQFVCQQSQIFLYMIFYLRRFNSYQVD